MNRRSFLKGLAALIAAPAAAVKTTKALVEAQVPWTAKEYIGMGVGNVESISKLELYAQQDAEATFRMHGTRTGRLAHSEPNMGSVPRGLTRSHIGLDELHDRIVLGVDHAAGPDLGMVSYWIHPADGDPPYLLEMERT